VPLRAHAGDARKPIASSTTFILGQVSVLGLSRTVLTQAGPLTEGKILVNRFAKRPLPETVVAAARRVLGQAGYPSLMNNSSSFSTPRRS